MKKRKNKKVGKKTEKKRKKGKSYKKKRKKTINYCYNLQYFICEKTVNPQ
jgi:chromatin remodeling complex protein RSC6